MTPAGGSADVRRPPKEDSVFLVHGRHLAARDQMAILLDSLRLNVVDWQEARELTGLASPTTLDIVAKGIESSQCLVVLLRGDDVAGVTSDFGGDVERLQPPPSVVFEAGLARATAGVGKTILVLLYGATPGFDLEGTNYLKLDNSFESRRTLVSRLEAAGCHPDTSGHAWASAPHGGDFALPAPVEVPEALDDTRFGLFTEYAVDTALSLKLTQEGLYRATLQAITKNEGLSLKFHYVGTRMAQWWIELCNDTMYEHGNSVRLTVESIPDVVEKAQLEGKSIDLVSLGPGEGKTEVLVLRKLLQANVGIASYFPVDLSLNLLQHAVVSVVDTNDLNGAFRIKAVVADFEENLPSLTPMIKRHGRPVLYMLTGYTIGNSNEAHMIDSIVDNMALDDLLVVDARLHRAGEVLTNDQIDDQLRENLVRPYSSELMKHFCFGPVMIASDFRITPKDVVFAYEVEVQGVTTVPHGINVFMTARTPAGPRLGKGSEKGQGAGSNAWLRIGRDGQPLRLATVTYYDFNSLCDWFVNRSLDVVLAKQQEGNGLFLLRTRKKN